MRCPDGLAVYIARSMRLCVWLPAHPWILSCFSPGLWWLLQAKWSRTSLVITLLLPLDSLQTCLDEIFVFLIIRRPSVSSLFDWLLNGSQALLLGVAVFCLLAVLQHIVINSSLACLPRQAPVLGTYLLPPSVSPFLPCTPVPLWWKGSLPSDITKYSCL